MRDQGAQGFFGSAAKTDGQCYCEGPEKAQAKTLYTRFAVVRSLLNLSSLLTAVLADVLSGAAALRAL